MNILYKCWMGRINNAWSFPRLIKVRTVKNPTYKIFEKINSVIWIMTYEDFNSISTIFSYLQLNYYYMFWVYFIFFFHQLYVKKNCEKRKRKTKSYVNKINNTVSIHGITIWNYNVLRFWSYFLTQLKPRNNKYLIYFIIVFTQNFKNVIILSTRSINKKIHILILWTRRINKTQNINVNVIARL